MYTTRMNNTKGQTPSVPQKNSLGANGLGGRKNFLPEKPASHKKLSIGTGIDLSTGRNLGGKNKEDYSRRGKSGGGISRQGGTGAIGGAVGSGGAGAT